VITRRARRLVESGCLIAARAWQCGFVTAFGKTKARNWSKHRMRGAVSVVPSEQWSGDAPMSGTFVIGSIHPPQWFTDYNPLFVKKRGYVLTPSQISQLIALVKTSRVAVTIEVRRHCLCGGWCNVFFSPCDYSSPSVAFCVVCFYNTRLCVRHP
jgi:hypothetical protein